MSGKPQVPKHHIVKRINYLAVIGIPVILAFAAILTLNCAGLPGAEEPREPNGHHTEKRETAALVPSPTPEGTVKVLYGDAIFFNLRNEIPPTVIEHLSPCITDELKAHFERHNEDIEAWMGRNKNTGLKLPVSEGPIFQSNYDGADSYRIGKASIDGKFAKVPVSLSITDAIGTYQWVDVVLLRRVGSVWALDNIRFDPKHGDNDTLLDRVALIE